MDSTSQGLHTPPTVLAHPRTLHILWDCSLPPDIFQGWGTDCPEPSPRDLGTRNAHLSLCSAPSDCTITRDKEMTRHNNWVGRRSTLLGRGWRSPVPTSVWFSCQNHTPHTPAGKYPQAAPRDEICHPFLAPGAHSPCSGFAAT